MARILLLQKENSILKRSVELKRKRIRLNFGDRLFYSILNRITDKTRYHFTLVKPETVLKWIKRFTKGYWRFPQKKKKTGRPETPYDIKQLVLNMKNGNICWGNGKIQGELEKLGIKLDKRTIARIIEDFRKKGRVRKGLTWSKFIQSNLSRQYDVTPSLAKSWISLTLKERHRHATYKIEGHPKGLPSVAIKRVQYVGLDVHKKSIEVSVLNGENAAPEIEKALPNQEIMTKVFLKG